MELRAVTAGLTFFPPDIVVWASTDSQSVQKGINEWIPNWKPNGWKNSKKARVANKSLWMSLDARIDHHDVVQFPWVKAHSGIVLNEIADTLATRGVNGSTYFPTHRFDELSADTEPEDGPELRGVASVITQIAEWDEEEHVPTSITQAVSYGFAEE
jgi:ribonuclease HI